MEIACVGNNTVTACPFCDELLVVKGERDCVAIEEKLNEHRAISPACDKQFSDLPTLQQICEQLATMFAKQDEETEYKVMRKRNAPCGHEWMAPSIRRTLRITGPRRSRKNVITETTLEQPENPAEAKRQAAPVDAVVMPCVGDKLQFGCREWEVSGVESVKCDYDSSYRFRVNLILRDHTGEPVNFATNIPNWCLD